MFLNRFIPIFFTISALIGFPIYAETSSSDIAERLVEYAHNKDNWPALHYAIEMERPDVAAEVLSLFPGQATMRTPELKLMMAHFGNNAADDYDFQVGTEQGISALELALRKGYIELAISILKLGANPFETRTEYFGFISDCWEPRGRQPVYEQVKFVVSSPGWTNYWTRSILYWAVEANSEEMVRLLLQQKVNLYGIKARYSWRVDPESFIERTSVHHAAYMASDEILTALISYQRDATNWEYQVIDPQVLQVFRTYVNQGSDWPPLHAALENHDVEAFSLLLEYGENMNWQGRAPHRLVEMAVAHEDTRFLNLMIAYGLSVDEVSFYQAIQSSRVNHAQQ